MTEYVLLGDAHANAPALQAVVDKEGTDSNYLVLGDIVGLCGYPDETVQTVRDVSDVALKGNHGKAIFHRGVGHVQNQMLSEFELSHTITSLSHEQIDWMQELDYMHVLTRNNNRVCLTHAYPWPERASGTEPGNAGVKKKDVVSVASAVSDDYDYVFHGHTHEQYDLDCSKWGHDVHFVNPGSLGYDSTYSLVNTDTGDVKHKSVEGEYDHDELVDHVQRELPEGAPAAHRWL